MSCCRIQASPVGLAGCCPCRQGRRAAAGAPSRAVRPQQPRRSAPATVMLMGTDVGHDPTRSRPDPNVRPPNYVDRATGASRGAGRGHAHGPCSRDAPRERRIAYTPVRTAPHGGATSAPSARRKPAKPPRGVPHAAHPVPHRAVHRSIRARSVNIPVGGLLYIRIPAHWSLVRKVVLTTTPARGRARAAALFCITVNPGTPTSCN